MNRRLFLLLAVALLFEDSCSNTSTEPKTPTNATSPKPDSVLPIIKPPQIKCNQILMESLDILGQENPVEERNLLCTGVQKNCCSYSSQLEIFKRWTLFDEKKMKSFYREFPKVMGRIFNSFLAIEVMAEKVIEATSNVPGSTCNRFATVIHNNPIGNWKNMVVKQAQKATEFLMQSRKGIYCSLCDANDHSFYDNDDFTTIVSHSFCARLVENTLPFNFFRYVHFIRLVRLYGRFLISCNFRGHYRKNVFLHKELLFFKHKKFEGHLNKCRRGMRKWNAIANCADYCSRFNPVKYDDDLEGELDRMASFSFFLTRRLRFLNKMELRLRKEEEANDKVNGRRILEESGINSSTPIVHKPHLEDSIDELTDFNNKFGTTLLKPVSYNFKTDLSVKYNLKFDESIFKLGFERVYNLVDYHTLVRKEGIDYFSLGDNANIDYDYASKIFELMNPDTRPSFSLDDFLKKN